MLTILAVDWRGLFVPTIPLGEIVFRGSVVYLALFFLLRLFRRQAGTIGISDVLVVVLIADAAQNAMASEYKTITEGLVLVTTIFVWDFLLDWLSYRVPAIRPLFRPARLPLIVNGRLHQRNMRQEMISEDELLAQLREQGVDDIADVKSCSLEGDGHVSVIKKAGGESRRRAGPLGS